MKILLVRNSGFRGETNITGVYPPLGIAYLAAVLRNSGYQVKILDNQVLNLNRESLKKEIKKSSPDIVLLSSMTPLWPASLEAAKIAKEISPRIIVGSGGPHMAVYLRESLLSGLIDFGVYGEGENTIIDVLKQLENKNGLDEVKGCVFRKNGETIVNPPREEIENLDDIQFPAVDLLPHKRYFALLVDHPFMTMITSRGCLYKCKFCFQGYLGKYRFRSPENVVEEMDICVNKYGVREIIIFDETFAAEKERVIKICELIKKKRLRFKWDIRTRVDLLDRDLLESLKSAGCCRLHLGIESGNQEILNRMSKGINISQIDKKIRLASELGFELRGYFMLGYPGETSSTIFDTIKFARHLPLDWASFTVTIGLPGTEIYNNALKNQYFRADYWREYTKGNYLDSKPYFVPEGMKEKDLFELKKKAYWEFYSRPRIICNVLKSLNPVSLIKNSRAFIKFLPLAYNSITKF